MASSPGLLIGGRGEGERRPGIHCMRMHYIFRVFYRKSVRKCSGQMVFVHGEASRNKYPDSHVFSSAPAHIFELALAQWPPERCYIMYSFQLLFSLYLLGV